MGAGAAAGVGAGVGRGGGDGEREARGEEGELEEDDEEEVEHGQRRQQLRRSEAEAPRRVQRLGSAHQVLCLSILVPLQQSLVGVSSPLLSSPPLLVGDW